MQLPDDQAKLFWTVVASYNTYINPARGGILAGTYEPGRLENAYYTFTAPDGRDILILSLEFGPRQAVVDWANEIASKPEFSDHTAILLTHAYMYCDNTRLDWIEKGSTQNGNPHNYGFISDDTHDGQELWTELVKKNNNFEFVFSGHIAVGDLDEGGVGTLTSQNDYGGLVHQILFNSQHINCGDGWLRLIEFHPNGVVQVKTYSPYLDQWRSDADDQFILELSRGTVPEPASISLFGIGSFLLIKSRKNK